MRALLAAAALSLLASAPAALAGIQGSGPRAHTAADVPIWTARVPLDRSYVFSPTLTAGTTYRLVATGTVTETEPSGLGFTSDALLRFICSSAGCPLPPSHLIVRYSGDSSHPNLDNLNPAAQLPYDGASHRYEETFTAARTGQLEAFLKPVFGSGGTFTQGDLTLELHAPAPAAPPPAAPGGPAAPQAGLDAVALANRWGRVVSAGALPPGGGAALLSPKLTRGQTEARVHVDTGPNGARETIVAWEDGPLTRGYCVRAYVAKVQYGAAILVGIGGDIDEALQRASFYGLEMLIACFDAVRRTEQALIDRGARGNALRLAAARSGCRTRATWLSGRLDRASRKLRYRVLRRPRRRPPSVRISCRQARGGLTVRFRARGRRDLRSIAGRRLRIGVYRSLKAPGNAKLSAVFERG